MSRGNSETAAYQTKLSILLFTWRCPWGLCPTRLAWSKTGEPSPRLLLYNYCIQVEHHYSARPSIPDELALLGVRVKR